MAPLAIAVGTANGAVLGRSLLKTSRQVAASSRADEQPVHPANETEGQSEQSHEENQEKHVCRVPEEKKRVFVHSMPKTGTTSVGKALKLLGYNDCSTHTMRSKASFESILPANELVKDYPINDVPEIIQDEVKAMLSTLKQDVDGLKESFYFQDDEDVENEVTCDSYSDFPIGLSTHMNIRLKMMLWPNSTYIWIDRPFDAWLQSLMEDRLSAGKDVNLRCSTPQMSKFIDDRKQELVELEKLIPGSVIFLNASTLDWDHLLPGLPVPKNCTPPRNAFPRTNTRNQTKQRHAKRVRLLQTGPSRFQTNMDMVLNKPCD